jgi:hypothetical protein
MTRGGGKQMRVLLAQDIGPEGKDYLSCSGAMR